MAIKVQDQWKPLDYYLLTTLVFAGLLTPTITASACLQVKMKRSQTPQTLPVTLLSGFLVSSDRFGRCQMQ
jgi:hypothetical protein